MIGQRRSMSYTSLVDLQDHSSQQSHYTATSKRLSEGDLLQSQESFEIELKYLESIKDSIIQSFAANLDGDVRTLACLISGTSVAKQSTSDINARLRAVGTPTLSPVDVTYLQAIVETHSRCSNYFRLSERCKDDVVNSSSTVQSSSQVLRCNAAVLLSSLYRSGHCVGFGRLPSSRSDSQNTSVVQQRDGGNDDHQSQPSTPQTATSLPRSAPGGMLSDFLPSSRESPRSCYDGNVHSPQSQQVLADGEAFRARMYDALNGNLDQFQRVLASAVDNLPGGSSAKSMMCTSGGLQPLIMMLRGWRDQVQQEIVDGLVVLSYMAMSEQLVKQALLLGVVQVLNDILAHAISPVLLSQAACTLGQLANKSPLVAKTLCSGRTLPLLKALFRRVHSTQVHLAVLTLLTKLVRAGCTAELAQHSMLTIVARTCLNSNQVSSSPEVLEAALLLVQAIMQDKVGRAALVQSYMPAYLAHMLSAEVAAPIKVMLLTVLKQFSRERTLLAGLLCSDLPNSLIALLGTQRQSKSLRNAALSLLSKCCSLPDLLAASVAPASAQLLVQFIRTSQSRRALPCALQVLAVLLTSATLFASLTKTAETFDTLCYIVLASKQQAVTEAAERAVVRMLRGGKLFSWMCKERVYYSSILLGHLMEDSNDKQAFGELQVAGMGGTSLRVR